MREKIERLVTRTLVAKAFAKKAPIIGAIIASEDVLKKLHAASSDYLSGHPQGAKNELQQAVTHAVGAGVNFLGGVSLVGMSAGLVAQTMAQRFAQQLAEQKPAHPRPVKSVNIVDSVLQTAQNAIKTAQMAKNLWEKGKPPAKTRSRAQTETHSVKTGTKTSSRRKSTGSARKPAAKAQAAE